MTKPLVLIIPPKLDEKTLRYIEGCKAGGYEPVFHTMPHGLSEMKAKRFTEAELAAEVLMHERDHWRDMVNGGIRQWRYDRLLKIRDIAARPHYDEDQS